MAQFILKLCFRVASLVVLLPLASGCELKAIGLASGGRIPDSSFSASSHYSSGYIPSYARLNGSNRGWAPKSNSDPADYLQIDLLYEYVICAVATQGAYGINEWTTKYKIRLSMDGITVVTYQENNVDRVFPGNSNQNGIVKNSLQEFASAKYIRFQPTTYYGWKALRVEVYGVLLTKVPSQPPTAFKLTASSSTSIIASWQLPPVSAGHGRNITGFKLFYRKKGSVGSATTLNISSGSTLSRNVTGLDKYTEYEFQVLAFTSDGDGPKSPVEVQRTMEDAPSQAPRSFSATAVTSTMITASWQLPPADSRNGLIVGFKLFYQKSGSVGRASTLTINDGTALSKDVTGLENNTEYEFEVLAFTSVGDGPKTSPVVVRTMKDGACVDFDLGMESGTIPDRNIIASSEESASTPGKNGRLNYASGSSWCAGTSDTSPYLQVDLQTLHIICAVSTQGNSQADQWVKNYTLQLSTDGTTWTDYKEGGQVKFLRGNADRESEVKHFVYGVLLRYLRFLPRTHQGRVCMRIEVFGVEKKPTCEMEAIGLASDGTIPDSSFSASSYYSTGYIPSNGRLNGNSLSWAPTTNYDPSDYLQIDLLYEYVICGVATQGANGINEWTTKYKIRLSMDGTTMVTYQENNVERVFPGNSNQNGIVKNSLQEFASAKYIRFQPTTYYGWKALRVEAYGILLTKVPSQPPTAFKLTASSSTSITASWQLPPVFARHGRTITGFKLFYRNQGYVSATTLTISSGSTLRRNVTGLDKYTEYEFQVLAFTSDGDGPKSSLEMERTMEDAPSQAPSSFRVTAVTSTMITASWQLPPADSRNGIIIGFKLFYQKSGSVGRASTLTINNGTALSKDVTGLENNTEYEFEVLAFTSVGDGPKTSPVVVRTMKDDKPHIKDLPKRTIKAVGELAVLTCEVSGDPEASVTWTKDGLTSIPRAKFKKNGKILIIQDVVPGDSGVYECIAMNIYGESRTASTLIVAAPPRIIEELTPSSVMCEKQTPCFLSCQATSYLPFNYSWTKDGQVPTGDGIKLMNNSIIVTPRDGKGYGEYVCRVTNSFGSTNYKITLLSPKDNRDDDRKYSQNGVPQSTSLAGVIALSCVVVVLLIIICGLIWQRRRVVPSERIQGEENVSFEGVEPSSDRQSNYEQASDLNTYIELKPRPSNHEQSHVPSEYQSLQEIPKNTELHYYTSYLEAL